jgi:hypothetical protein
MGKDKSIIEKITDTMKDIGNIAADAANHALEAEKPPLKADQRSAVYIPLAADGLVSDPMMVPPIAVAPTPRRKRAARKQAANEASKTAKKKKAVKKSAKKAVKKAAAKRSSKAAKKTAKKTSRKSASKAARKTRKGIR